jgi:hypothetical protein
MKRFKIPAINSLIKDIKESEGNYWMRKSIEDVISKIKEGDEVMEWLSPWKPGYRFIFSRHENSFTEARVGNQFIIEIKVLDTFYNFITVIKMNEMDALRTIDSKNVRILLNSEISPIILNTEDNDDLLQLLMPIKTY